MPSLKVSPESSSSTMKREDFLEILCLEAHHLDRDWDRGGSLSIPLKIGVRVGGSVQAKQVDLNRLELVWSVANRRETLELDCKWIATEEIPMLCVRCPHCTKFRKQLFFTLQPAATFSFACRKCVGAASDFKPTQGGRRRPTKKIGTAPVRRGKFDAGKMQRSKPGG